MLYPVLQPQNPANSHSGSYYAEVTGPAGYTTTTLTTTQPISSQIGEIVTAAGWTYHETNSNGYTRWFLTVQGSNGSINAHPVDNSTLNTWIFQTVSVQIPSYLNGPYTATVYAQVVSDSNSISARFDDVTLNGNMTLFAADSLGTSRVVTDSNGIVCYDGDFYPYGGERAYTNTCDPVYKFEGKERDAEPGNDDFGARYYSNRFGRWLSADWSSVPVAVPYANLTNPQTLNLYSMVADDPESFADLDGHDGLWVVDKQSGQITLVIPVHFTGSGATPENVKAITNRDNNLDTGGSPVKIQVVTTDKPVNGVLNTMDLSPGKDPENHGTIGEGVKGLGGDTGHINTDNAKSNDAAAHDTLHFAGIKDQYVEGPKDANGHRTSTPTPGYDDSNIMTSRNGTKLKPEQIQEAQKSKTTKPCTSDNGKTVCK